MGADLFQLFMRHLPGVAWIKDAQGRYVFVNDEWETVYRQPRAQILGRRTEELWASEDAAQYIANDRRVFKGWELVRTLETVPGDDGVHHWLGHRFPIADPLGAATLLGSVTFDVTDRVRAEQKLRRANRALSMLSGISSAIVRLRDSGALVLEACRRAVESGQFASAWVALKHKRTGALEMAATAQQGATAAAPSAHMQAIARSPLVDKALRDQQPQLWTAEELLADFSLRDWAAKGPCAAALPLLLGGEAVGVMGLLASAADFFNDEEMKVLVEVAGDVAFGLDHIEKEQRLAYLANFDALTELPNRTLRLDRLSQQLQAHRAGQERLGVVVLNIKRFSVVNDTLGRHAGDALLRQFAARLTAAAQRARRDADHVATNATEFETVLA